MENSNPAKRTYNAARRRQQAELTRQAIIESAQRLFDERGYAATTIETIAQEAGVATETVYAVFGNKAAILHKILDVRLVGDYDSTPFFNRPFIHEALQQPNPRDLIAHFAHDMFRIMTRVSPVFALMRSTAKGDEEISALLQNVLQSRRQGMMVFVNGLLQFGPLRAEMTPEQAGDTVFALSSPEVFTLLTRDLSWSEDQYVHWLSDAIEQLLLG